MKKFLGIFALFLALAFGAPAFAGDSPSIVGVIYQNTTSPGDGFETAGVTKGGSASCKSIFWLVAVGNCSVRQAMKNGGISALSHYDIQKENILGIQTITVKAYGR